MIGAGPIRLGRTGPTAYDLVRVALGLLLLVAAGLKAHEVLTQPPLRDGLFGSRWFLIGLVDFELLFGLWLLGGFYPRATRLAAVILFASFAAVSLGKALSGAASCGCFGRVEVNPWFTFILDLAAVAALVWLRPQQCVADPLRPASRRGWRVPFAAGSLILVGMVAVLLAASGPATLSNAGEILGDGSVVVLEPERWVGKRFPLLPHVNIDVDLARGKWVVLLYRRGCARCEETLRHIRQAVCAGERDLRLEGFAVVEVAHERAVPERLQAGFLVGALDTGRIWVVRAPVLVTLEDRYVVACSS